MTSSWLPGTMMSSPWTSERRPRRSNTRRIIRRSSGRVSLTTSSPPVTPASAMNEPISMWSGAIVCVQPRSARPDRGRSCTLEPMPSMSAPICSSIRARSWTWGSEAALRMTVVPRVSAAAISAFSVAITEGSSIRKSQGPQAQRRRGEHDLVAAVVDGRAERAERVEVRVEPAAADHVAAGRGHLRRAEARQQRAGEQERGPDPLGQARVDLGALHRGAVDEDLAGSVHSTRAPRTSSRRTMPRRRRSGARCAGSPRPR